MRVLLPLCRTVREGLFYQDFYVGLIEALLELGHEPLRFPFATIGQPAMEEAEALYREVQQQKPDSVLDLCCWGYGLSQTALTRQDGKPVPIFDLFDLPYAGMLFDQPFNQAINAIQANRLYATYPDRGHGELARLVFPNLKLRGEIFSPPAIRPGNDRSARARSERDIDVLYVGNLVPEALERFWRDPANRLWRAPFVASACDAIADAALAEPGSSLLAGSRSAIAHLGRSSPGIDFNPQLHAVELLLRFTYRRDAVMSIARSGVRMRVTGNGWDAIALPANVELGGETDYDGMFRLAARAKICLDASTYVDGVNDRVFSYALNGAVTFTNAAGYLRDAFGEENGLHFYSMRSLSELGEQVKALLARPDTLSEAGERARQTVLAAHTWRHRVEQILESMCA
jgi:glycosyltransferase involved in cell wall biosynthesis